MMRASALLLLLPFLVAFSASATVQRWNSTVFPSPRFGHVTVPLRLDSIPSDVVSRFNLSPSASDSNVGDDSSHYMVLDGGWPWDTSLAIGQSYAFDPRSGNWFVLETSGPAPSRRHYHSAVTADDGSFAVVYGGFRSGALGDVIVLSAGADAAGASRLQWTAVTPRCASGDGATTVVCGSALPSSRYAHTAVLQKRSATDYDVVVFGGVGEAGALGDFHVLRIVRGSGAPSTWTYTWSTPSVTGDVPAARGHHAAALVGDVMFVFGGTSDLILPLNEQLLYSIDLTSFACTSIAIPAETDEALALHPFFSQGVWGLTMSAYPDTDAQFLFLFGGQSTDVSGEAPISMWSSTMVMYDVGADAWSVLSQSETVETTGLLPTGRRSLSVSVFPDSDGARFVFFGGVKTPANPSNEMNMFQPRVPFYAVQTDADSLPPTLAEIEAPIRPRWVDVAVDSVEPQTAVDESDQRSGNVLFDIRGTGFSDPMSGTYLTSIKLYELERNYDPHSPAIVNRALSTISPDCLPVTATTERIQCYAVFKPNGYYLVEASVTDRYGVVVSVARRVAYHCLNTDEYKEFALYDANTNQVDDVIKSMCLRKPVVTEVEPGSGYGGMLITVHGATFNSVVPSMNSVTVGGEPCVNVTNVAEDGTLLQCTLQARFGSGNISVAVEVKRYLALLAQPSRSFYANVQATSSVDFEFVIALDKMVFAPATNESTVLTIQGRGFAPSDDPEVNNVVRVQFIRGTTYRCSKVNATLTVWTCILPIDVATIPSNNINLRIDTVRTADGELFSSQSVRGIFCKAGQYNFVKDPRDGQLVIVPATAANCPASVTSLLPQPSSTTTVAPTTTNEPGDGTAAPMTGIYAAIGGAIAFILAVIGLAAYVWLSRRKKRLALTSLESLEEGLPQSMPPPRGKSWWQSFIQRIDRRSEYALDPETGVKVKSGGRKQIPADALIAASVNTLASGTVASTAMLQTVSETKGYRPADSDVEPSLVDVTEEVVSVAAPTELPPPSMNLFSGPMSASLGGASLLRGTTPTVLRQGNAETTVNVVENSVHSFRASFHVNRQRGGGQNGYGK